MTQEQPRTKWGRTKFGAGRLPAMAIAFPGGLILGAFGGWLSVVTGVSGQNPLVGFWVFSACLTSPAVLLVYAVVVDRTTIEGAVDRPDDSIEAGWYDKAASSSFTDLILMLGATAAILAFLPTEILVDLKLVLSAVLVACALSFGLRYLLLKRKG